MRRAPPTFLIKLLLERRYFIPKIEDLETGEEIIESFDVDQLQVETLLFQTGYLTIKEKIEPFPGEVVYRLRYPKREVKKALSEHILNYFVDLSTKTENKLRLGRMLREGDLEGLKEVFRAFFASIPHDWYRKSDLHHYEGFYASIFYAYFAALGLEVRAEDATNVGRLDLSVVFEGRCYLFEFKVVELEPEGRALEQLKAKGYHEKYAGRCREIYLIGVEFSKRERNIVGFSWKRV